MVSALILVFVTAGNPLYARFTAPLYAFAEGMMLGAFSSWAEARYPGIAMQAVFLTLAVFVTMWMIYTTGIIKVTSRLRTGILAAMGGIMVFYLVTLIAGLFGVSIAFLFSGGIVGIGISLFITIVAAYGLLLDFDLVAELSERGVSKELEWYGAFGLIVSLVWLYVEILRLLRIVKE